MFQIGQWVEWYAPTRKRHVTGRIHAVNGEKAYIVTRTYDGRGHHWYVPFKRLRKVEL